MEQEHRITYKAGITRTPSDFLCQDGELAECINLATDNEELKPVVQPEEYITNSTHNLGIPTILYIHKFNNSERYIGYLSNNQMVWAIKSNKTLINITNLNISYDDTVKIESIGKTLIISRKNYPIKYYIWKNNNTYSNAIDNLPQIKLKADLQRRGIMSHTGNMTDIFGETRYLGQVQEIHQEEYNDLVVGLYSQNKKEIKHKKCFSEPFFVCAALEMFDGTYTMVTQPILLPVAVTNNVYGKLWVYPSGSSELTYARVLKVITSYAELAIQQETDFSVYDDIVKDVVLFATDGINFYDIGGDQTTSNIPEGEVLVDGIIDHHIITESRQPYPTTGSHELCLNILKKRPTREIEDDVKGASIFYRICSLGKKPRSMYPVTGLINSYAIEQLNLQPRLDNIDFYSNSDLYAEMLFGYNSRLNISGVERSIFPGFDYFMPFGSETSGCTIKVEIETDSGDKVAVLENVSIPDKTGYWFFYPDSRAKKVVITGGVNFSHKLDEHPGLNGACCFLGFPRYNTDTPSSDSSTITTTDSSPERLANYILQSEVNNPWVFKAEGYFKVGTGNILGMSTITQALSQGQFGQYPLLVFSESGIWALSVGSEGYYTAIHPMSRDVCINPGSILQTDGAVFFVSKKGLMVVAGNEVVCVSERMNGATFNTAQLSPLADDTDWEDIVEACQDSNSFLDYIRDEGMFMAYDYIDSRIVMVNPRFGYSFIYNIADATISKVILPAAMTNAVNNYPDYLIQGLTDDNHQRVYSFYEKKREEEVTGRQLGFLLTRPMKLSGPTAKASLRQLMHVGMWNKGTASNPLSCVKTEIWLSDNLQTWYSDISRFGTAAKYYRLALYIKMLPTERLSGTILTEQPRRTKNLK